MEVVPLSWVMDHIGLEGIRHIDKIEAHLFGRFNYNHQEKDVSINHRGIGEVVIYSHDHAGAICTEVSLHFIIIITVSDLYLTCETGTHDSSVGGNVSDRKRKAKGFCCVHFVVRVKEVIYPFFSDERFEGHPNMRRGSWANQGVDEATDDGG